MSKEYDRYIEEHRENVYKAFDWIESNLPDIFKPGTYAKVKEHMSLQHDFSKEDPEEYEAYDAYFYGKHITKEVKENFNRAWLRHIHLNPHHWQYWVLIHDDEFEQLREDCKNFYKFDGCGCGGPLHILLDDDNFHDDDILFCMGECLDREFYTVPDEARALGLIICAKYAKLSMPERAAFDCFWCGEKLDCTDPQKYCEDCSIMSLLK